MLGSLFSGLRSILYTEKSNYIRRISNIAYVAGENTYKVSTKMLPNDMLEATRAGCPVPVTLDCSNSNLIQRVTFNNLPECGSFSVQCGKVVTEYFDPKNALPKLQALANEVADYLPSAQTTVIAVSALALVTVGCCYAYSRLRASNDTASTTDITAAQRNTPNLPEGSILTPL